MPDVTPRRTKAKPANVSTRRPRLGRPELHAKLEAPVARTGRQRPWQEWYLAIRVKTFSRVTGSLWKRREVFRMRRCFVFAASDGTSSRQSERPMTRP